MWFMKFLVVISCLCNVCLCEFVVDDFSTNASNTTSWKELSDTIMEGGRSKAVLVSHNTDQFQRAILFTLLDPQSCGAAIAGIKKYVEMDLTEYKSIELRVRGRGQYTGYEFVIRHKSERGPKIPSYVHYFEAPKDFETITLPIDAFEAYLEGKPVKNAAPLDKTKVTALGILAYGGVHVHRKQYGVGALEIDWIKIS
ncbi:unnamed protein product [Acanthoscelides obtectus]|uniref:NADH:ubiquinone oxidoreductase intermediate-associated protein 30 domain-containing protein n=1 Tax=Acanthoscelides obtectus TaxID=200917 RepID=A0A9P0P081_ACAOB|nr:unnamed protein product [Acanthoscelides obtectus]CAK1625261.1 hypothetical protein AOBTE_LOCUS3066 [Acanthoscelides obtectus]